MHGYFNNLINCIQGNSQILTFIVAPGLEMLNCFHSRFKVLHVCTDGSLSNQRSVNVKKSMHTLKIILLEANSLCVQSK